jgi:hypothetical protein
MKSVNKGGKNIKTDMGKTQWVYPDLELPPPGDFPLKGHESLIILNMNDSDVSIVFCLYFTDKEPIELVPVKVAARRVRCFRLDDVDGIGIRIPRETQYVLRVKKKIPKKMLESLGGMGVIYLK